MGHAMKRVALLSVILALVVSLAAPTGAAFALEEVVEVPIEVADELVETTGEQELQSDKEITPTVITQTEEVPVEPDPSLSPPTTPEAPVIITPPSAPIITEPVTTPPLVVTTFDVSQVLEFVELYNQSSMPIAVSDVRIEANAGQESCLVGLADDGFVMPGEFFYARSPSYLPGHFERRFSSECLLSSEVTRLAVFVSGSRVQLLDGISLEPGKWGAHGGAWSKGARKTFTSVKQSGSFANDYVLIKSDQELYSSTAYLPPDTTKGLEIVEILPNARSCAPSDVGDDCADYIKLHNNSEDDINLALFRLRTGSRTANATMTTAFTWHEPTLHPDRDELVLSAGAYFMLRLRNDGVPLTLSNAEGNVWLEDYFGIRAYQSVTYTGMDLAAARGKTWALNADLGTWQFGIPSPGRANVLYVPVDEPGKGSAGNGLMPCDEHQYRSEETNRCRNIVTASTLTPCREGQYRSEETNRCRSIATAAASVLKPCADGQFRNPETNRCKKIASSEDIALADCGEGRERNPETNRCRNVVAAGTLADTLPFPIEQTEERPEQFIGWWLLAIVTALGAGYGAWEWREELGRYGRRALRFISRSK